MDTQTEPSTSASPRSISTKNDVKLTVVGRQPAFPQNVNVHMVPLSKETERFRKLNNVICQSISVLKK